jgi:hypothetical protein
MCCCAHFTTVASPILPNDTIMARRAPPRSPGEIRE